MPDAPIDYHDALYSLAFEVYHMRSFIGIWKNLDQVRRANDPRPYRRSRYLQMLESASFVHMRTVLYFVFRRGAKRRSHNNDVTMQHFYSVQVRRKKFKQTALIDEVRESLDTRVAHLTLGRRKGQLAVKKYFDVAELLSEYIDEFLATLPQEYQDTFFNRIAKEFEPRDSKARTVEFCSCVEK